MALKKRTLRLARHNTSVALEPEFWAVLEQMAAGRQLTLVQLVSEVDAVETGKLASALRLAVLRALQTRPH